ncbi:MAG TPA: hypothetical protein VGI99_14335 [Gemmataceae bacterium]|jgi:regulation of enolase protein 1 (concanavalin A-like superfamily)
MRIALAIVAAMSLGMGCQRRSEPTADSNEPSPPIATVAPVPKDTPAKSPARTVPAAPVVRAAGTTIAGWGKVFDPDGDCVVREHPEGVSIAIPNVLHELNPTRAKPNSPLVLQPVDGDFRAIVRVTGEFIPRAPSTSKTSAAFHGAGLVLYEDERNYLMVARDCWIGRDGKGVCFAPLFELFEKGGAIRGNGPFGSVAAFQGDSTTLYLERKGDTVRGAFSNDGKTWLGWQERTVHMPRAVQVGIASVNTAAEPFSVAFDGFKLSKE